MLTGEADGVRKGEGDRVLSGSFCISGSGYYVVDAVREESYAEKVAGEARTFRHPPSPLQDEVNRVITPRTYVMMPLAVDPDLQPSRSAAPTSTRRRRRRPPAWSR